MFDWLEDLGEVVLDVGADVAKSTYGSSEQVEEKEPPAPAKPPLSVATPSAYSYVQKPIAVNDNGAPVKSVQSQMSQNNMLMIGGGAVILVLLVLAISK